jgi:hypothetical protein
MDGYGKLFLLLLAIGAIWIGTSGRGRVALAILMNKQSSSPESDDPKGEIKPI